jgi:predicted transcriptional regulator
MAKTKVREIILKESSRGFLFGRAPGVAKTDFDFSGIHALRQVLSNEKARILYTIKHKNPKSIYELAKILKRGFKAVKVDLDLLERFGVIEFTEEKTKNRIRHKPEVVVDRITLHVDI